MGAIIGMDPSSRKSIFSLKIDDQGFANSLFTTQFWVFWKRKISLNCSEMQLICAKRFASLEKKKISQKRRQQFRDWFWKRGFSVVQSWIFCCLSLYTKIRRKFFLNKMFSEKLFWFLLPSPKKSRASDSYNWVTYQGLHSSVFWRDLNTSHAPKTWTMKIFESNRSKYQLRFQSGPKRKNKSNLSTKDDRYLSLVPPDFLEVSTPSMTASYIDVRYSPSDVINF